MKIPGTTKHIYFGKKDADASPSQSSAGPSNAPATTSRERPIVPGLVHWSSGKRAPARSADTSAPTRAPRATGEALAQLGLPSRDAESSPAPEVHGNEPGPSTDGGRRDTASRKATAPPPELIAKILEVIARDETPQVAAITLARVALASHDMEDQVKRIVAGSSTEISRRSSYAALNCDGKENLVAVLRRYPHVQIPTRLPDSILTSILDQMAKVTREDLKTTRSISITPFEIFSVPWGAGGNVRLSPDEIADCHRMAERVAGAVHNLSLRGSDDLSLTLELDLGRHAARLRTPLREIMASPQSKLRVLTVRTDSIRDRQEQVDFEREVRAGMESPNNAVEHLALHVGASPELQAAILRAAAKGGRVRTLSLLSNDTIDASAVTEALQDPRNNLEELALHLHNMDATGAGELQQGLTHDNARHLTRLNVKLRGNIDGLAFGRAVAHALVHLRPAQPGEAAGTSSASIVNPLSTLVINGRWIQRAQAGAMFTALAEALPNPACGLRSLALHRMDPNPTELHTIIQAAMNPNCRLEVLDLQHAQTLAMPYATQVLDQARVNKPGLQILTPWQTQAT